MHRPYFIAPALILFSLFNTSTVMAQSVTDTLSESRVLQGSIEDLWILALYVFLALLISFLCSIAEAVLLSITPSYIEELKESHPALSKVLKKLKYENVDQSLAAILTLNTIAHTVGAIVSGAKASEVFGNAWFGLFSAIMTLLILFLSEIIPKTIGAVYWPKLVVPAAYFIRSLIFILFPLVWVSERLTKLVSQGKEVHIFSRNEFIAMTRVGEESGLIKSSESRIIHNLFKLESLKVRDIMTPRTVVFALSESLPVTEAYELLRKKTHSRIPIYNETIDQITGFILRDDVLINPNQAEANQLLKSLKREILVVPDFFSLTVLMESLLKDRKHIALVVDEYGGTKGIVTLEDLIETLVGVEIIDEQDKVADMQALARNLWKKRAKALGLEENFDETAESGLK
jgi:CBS domain containing-hemolysin-like protein